MSLQERGEAEAKRILAAFQKNPYEVLDLPAFASETEVKKQYRKKSLLIHPDKFKHEKGDEVFDLLKKAQDHLLDENRRANIDSMHTLARTQVLKAALKDAYTPSIPNDDPRITSLNPPYETQLRKKVREVIIEDSLSVTKRSDMVKRNEEEERKQKEEQVAARKRKHEDQQAWESRRDERVDDWRGFNRNAATKKAKKAKKNLHVLG